MRTLEHNKNRLPIDAEYVEYDGFLSLDDMEYFEERAAIMEYEGGLSRKEAENLAIDQLIRLQMRLSA